MKKHIPSFLAGTLAATIAFSLGLTAMAVSGNIFFNQIEVSFGGETVIAQEDLTLSSGARVPSSITYNDETGGGTVYLPLRKMSELVGASLVWHDKEAVVFMDEPYLLKLMKLPLYGGGAVIDGCLQEVTPIIPDAEPNFLAPVSHKERTAFERILPMDEAKGDHISVTVTNHSEYPVEYQLGVLYDPDTDGRLVSPTLVPAHSTVTRTMQWLEETTDAVKTVYISVGYEDDVFQESDAYNVDVTVEAVQFTK